MKTEQEKLTEAERRDLWLGECGVDWQRKALRIIDAQAARVTELEGWYTRAMRDIVDLNKSRGATERENARLTEQVAQLTAERDDALREYEIAAKSYKQACVELDGSESEVARLTEALADAKENLRAANIAYDRLERDRDAALRKLGELGVWADTYGAALTPHGGAADTYGDGVRACKTQVKAMLSSQPATPLRCSPDPFGERIRAHLSSQPAQAPTSTLGHPGADEVFARLRQSRQPAAPTRTDGNYSLAELRRIIRAEPGSLTGAELVVRDTMLEMCAPRTDVETVDCEACAIRGIECDNGDHCDSCGNRMDGYVAATADVCHDCWQAAKSRTAAESELTALTRDDGLGPRALEALRGR